MSNDNIHQSDFEESVDLAASINTIIAFLAFTIVYANLWLSTGIFELLFGQQSGLMGNRFFKIAVLGAFLAPLIFAFFLTVMFVWEMAKLLFSELEYSDTSNIFGFAFRIGAFVGAISFVSVLAIFVAFQSNEYLEKVGPDFRQFVAQLFGI